MDPYDRNRKFEVLTDQQIKSFMEDGYLVVKDAFTPDQAADFTKDLWIRIGYDPEDKSTWENERLHLPRLRWHLAPDFSPKAWGAMCDLLGGKERVDENSAIWGDGFILNLGTSEDEAAYTPPEKLTDWHVDGDFFLHFLDSPEQALLVVPIFSKIEPRGGATYIAPNSIASVAKRLADHPKGLLPGRGLGDEYTEYLARLADSGDHFIELTGDVGDVVLIHPLMLHSASKNCLRIPRIITNPPVGLKEPFNFNRPDPRDFSLVELKTLKSLGLDQLDFKPTVARRKIIPAAWAVKDEKKRKELQRLKEHAEANNLPIPAICVQ